VSRSACARAPTSLDIFAESKVQCLCVRCMCVQRLSCHVIVVTVTTIIILIILIVINRLEGAGREGGGMRAQITRAALRVSGGSV
jgi:hypothetical protein